MVVGKPANFEYNWNGILLQLVLICPFFFYTGYIYNYGGLRG